MGNGNGNELERIRSAMFMAPGNGGGGMMGHMMVANNPLNGSTAHMGMGNNDMDPNVLQNAKSAFEIGAFNFGGGNQHHLSGLHHQNANKGNHAKNNTRTQDFNNGQFMSGFANNNLGVHHESSP